MKSRTKRRRRGFAVAALLAVSLAGVLVSLGAMLESISIGVAFALLLAVVVVRSWPRAGNLTADAVPRPFTFLPVYLIVLPIMAFALRVGLADPAAEFSRNRAIRNASALIADIERYHQVNGRYPVSTLSVHPDYNPGLIGIRDYRYEPNGTAYNIQFVQHSLRLGVKEVAMYNPRGEHGISSHAADVLQMTPEQLALDRTRGHNEVHDAGQVGWKYFLFD